MHGLQKIGNDYIDYMCAYGPMILGYNHPAVDAAAQAQYKKGNTVSLAAPVIIELAELMAGHASVGEGSRLRGGVLCRVNEQVLGRG